MHGTSFAMSQSGQRNENPGMPKIMLKLPMVLMKVTPMLKGLQEERLRRRQGSVQIVM
jgi:hypothetical protein